MNENEVYYEKVCCKLKPYRQCKSCGVVRCQDCESTLPNGIDYYTGLCRDCAEQEE